MVIAKRTEWEMALTCKGHGGVFPQATRLLLTAGFTEDILGAGEVEHKQCEAGWQQGDSQGSQNHHGGPLCGPSSQLQTQAGGRPAMQTLKLTMRSLTTRSLTNAHFSQVPLGCRRPHRLVCLINKFILYLCYLGSIML